MSKMSANEVMSQIVETSKNNSTRLRNVTKMKVGEVVRQGDLYIEKVASLPENKGAVTENVQLAVGQTQGSRHVISPKPAGLSIFSPPAGSTVLTGPSISSTEAWTLTHPEHGHFKFGPGNFQVTYQKDYAKERAEELRRVQD